MADTKIVPVQTTSSDNESRDSSVTAENAESIVPITQLYVIDLKTWGIYNDGTHPIETEKGINAAIKWAKNNGYEGVYLKGGTYLIEPTYYADPVKKTGGASPSVDKYTSNLRGIQPVSNSIFEMSMDTIIQVNTNNAHMHTAILCYLVNNVTIRGGQVIGDKDTHIWTYYGGYGMGGHGYGLDIQQSSNIKVFDTKFSKHHGDGIMIGGTMDHPPLSNDTLDNNHYNIYMKNVVCDNNSRQGMSLSGDNMLFEDCTFSGSNGQAPEAGVDIESGAYQSTNIVFRRCVFTKNSRDGLINYDGNVKIENCLFTQGMGINGSAGDTELIDSIFTNKDKTDYYYKYPYILTVDRAYQVGDRARIDLSLTSEGYTCTKAGTTFGTMARKDNWPPAAIQSSMLGIVYTYGDTEWTHTDNYYSYAAGGLNGASNNQAMPANQRVNSTFYAIGKQVRLANGTALVCTVAGTSGTSDPSTIDKYVGDTLIDGTVNWKLVDNYYPKGYRKSSTAYVVGEIIWWGDGITTWECVTAGTTASAPPTLKEVPNDTILIAHASTSRIKKIAFDSTAPEWKPNVIKNHLDKVNIAGTTWQFIEKTNYKILFDKYTTGDTEPNVTNIPRGDTLTDGTVVWKKIADKISKTVVDGCKFINTNLTVGGGSIVSKNNKITNGIYTLTGIEVISQNNTILNNDANTTVTYTLTNGKVCNEYIKGSRVTVLSLHDRKNPSKRLIEHLSMEDVYFTSDTAILYDSSIVYTEKYPGKLPFAGNHLRMIGGKIKAYLNPSVVLFSTGTRWLMLNNVLIEAVLSTGANFMKVHSRSYEGGYPIIEDCTFKVTPLDYNNTLIGIGYSDANIKLLNNKFFNTDYSKSIIIDLPPTDKVNTCIKNNFFDTNYYVTDINSVNNIGGYGIRTSLESMGVPTSGKYALGTRVMNVSPAIGSPKSWLVTTEGFAYSTIRANSTAYTVGTFVKWSSGDNIYECIVAGSTGASVPKAGGGTVVDGTVIWLYRGNKTAVFTSEGNL